MMKIEARRNSVCMQRATAAEVNVSGTAIDTELSAWIVDLFSGKVVNAADLAAPLRLPRRVCPIHLRGR
jgi:hypothetical protein